MARGVILDSQEGRDAGRCCNPGGEEFFGDWEESYPNYCRKMNTSRKWKERRLTQGTCCSTCLRGGREGVPAASGTCRRDQLLSRRHRPLDSSHSCHSSPRATCLQDRRRRRPEPTGMRLETQGRRQIGWSVCASPTAQTFLQRTGARNTFLNCPKDPSISDLSKGWVKSPDRKLTMGDFGPTDIDAGHFGVPSAWLIGLWTPLPVFLV